MSQPSSKYTDYGHNKSFNYWTFTHILTVALFSELQVKLQS